MKTTLNMKTTLIMKTKKILFIIPLIFINSYSQISFQENIITNSPVLGDYDTISVYSFDIDGDGDLDFISTHRFDGRIAWSFLYIMFKIM